MKLFASALLSLFVVSTFGRAQELTGREKAATHWRIFAECRMATVPQKKALTLISEFGEPDKVTEAWDRLERMLVAGEAKLEADLVLRGAEDKRLISESMAETKVALEYEPPKIPERLSSKAAPEALKAWPFLGMTPTAFQSLNIGESFELTAHVSEDGKWIAVSVQASHTRLLEWAKFELAELPGGERIAISQPRVNRLENTTSFQLRNGEKMLLGVHKLEQPEKTFELFVLQVKASVEREP